jgi:glycine oxidase
MSENADVAIVGAGLIGLAIAFELAERGATVRVYDRDEPARAASWAGAGMLAPYTEHVRDDALLQLGASSLAEYPHFVQRVRDAGRVDPRLRLNGVVHAAFGAEHLERLRRRAETLHARGVVCEILDRTQAIAAEPWLGPRVSGALFVEGEGYVDNRRLGRALVAACRERDVGIVRVEMLAVECDDRRTLGVRTDLGFTPSGAVINAAGAWAAIIDGIPPSARPSVEPRKGQMLALAAPVGFARHATWLADCYLVPRDDGRLLIGATDERAGFDVRVTAGGVRSLLDGVLRHAPALAGFSISEMWAGLRPGSADGRPFIGPTSRRGLFVAGGHYRNGILLAPVTARLVSDCVEGRTGAEVDVFGMERRRRGANDVLEVRS